jgi:hypothetical protein
MRKTKAEKNTKSELEQLQISINEKEDKLADTTDSYDIRCLERELQCLKWRYDSLTRKQMY